jgi:hypothetical protein
MSESDEIRVRKMLDSLGESINQLEALELSYKQQKERITSTIASSVHQIATLSDTQAIRAKVIRDLYWNKKIRVTLICEAFGLKVGAVKRIAGPMLVALPCANACGNTLKKSFHSMTALEDHFREARKSAKRSWLMVNVCEECEKKRKAESEADSARAKQAILKRNEKLRAMIWEDFIETEEWMNLRSRLIHNLGYQCEICHTRHVSLYVFLHKDTPQDNPSFYFTSEAYNYFVLCRKCVDRCRDLINEDKGEFIKKEFFTDIMTWYNSN